MKIGKINIYDFIGEGGITARDISLAFQSLEDQGINKFEITINSRGGEVFEGLAIFNEIKSRDCEIFISGIAASIASVIALAGKKVSIYKNSFIMIHNPFTFAVGDQNDLKKTADDIEMLRLTIIDTYKIKTGKTEDELKALMDGETFFTAETAMENGFVDEIIELPAIKNYVALYTEIYDDNQN